MLKCDMTRRKLFVAILVATALIGSALPGSKFALAAGGACALVSSERDPSEKTLQCGQELTVRPAHGTSYRPLYNTGQQLPAAIRLDNGALLIEYHPDSQQIEFQILTPLAIAAVRGTKWAANAAVCNGWSDGRRGVERVTTWSPWVNAPCCSAWHVAIGLHGCCRGARSGSRRSRRTSGSSRASRPRWGKRRRTISFMR